MLGGQNVFRERGEHLYKISLCAGVGLSTGRKRHQERQIRLYCRHVLLDCWPNQSVKKFWLNLLLNPWPLVSQARLLFILYGPSLPDGKNERHLPHMTRVCLARLSPCSIKLCVLNGGTNSSLQEPWIGIAWRRWSCHAGLCGMWPMPYISCLVTPTWKISPISQCWPSWRSLSVSHFISCQHLSAHTAQSGVTEKTTCSVWAPFFSPPPVVPQQWHVDNVARLLVLCESSLCYNILASKAINGRLFEVSRLLVHIVLVSVIIYFKFCYINHEQNTKCWLR